MPFLLISLLAMGQSSKSPSGGGDLGVLTSRFKIAIDAGHGGDDSGAKSHGKLKEKDIALAMAYALKESLEAAGMDALLTREDDTFIPLLDRSRKANDAGADLFLSLHLNAARSRGAKGSEVYFLSLGSVDAETAAVAALENAGGGSMTTADSVVASILDDMAQKAFLQDSQSLAVIVQNQLNRLGGIQERGVKQAPFAVLRGAAMPAILVETAFLSNPKEEAKLKDPEFQKRVADSITLGVRRFLLSVGVTPRRRAPEH